MALDGAEMSHFWHHSVLFCFQLLILASSGITENKPIHTTFLCCCCSEAKSLATLHDLMGQSTPDPAPSPVSWSLPNCPLLPFPSNVSQHHSNQPSLLFRWLKYLSFSICPSKRRSGLVSFRIDTFDLLAVQGTPYSWVLLNLFQSKRYNSRVLAAQILRASFPQDRFRFILLFITFIYCPSQCLGKL